MWAARGESGASGKTLMLEILNKLLAHPATRDLAIDAPRTTERRTAIIVAYKFLSRIYDKWYGLIADCIPAGPGQVVELGSGAGFLRRYVPNLIASEVFVCDGIQVIADARALPFGGRQRHASQKNDRLSGM